MNSLWWFLEVLLVLIGGMFFIWLFAKSNRRRHRDNRLFKSKFDRSRKKIYIEPEENQE